MQRATCINGILAGLEIEKCLYCLNDNQDNNVVETPIKSIWFIISRRCRRTPAIIVYTAPVRTWKKRGKSFQLFATTILPSDVKDQQVFVPPFKLQ